jgi:hypothetical protein
MILWKISTANSIKHRISATFNKKNFKINSDSLYFFVPYWITWLVRIVISWHYNSVNKDSFWICTRDNGKFCVYVQKIIWTILLKILIRFSFFRFLQKLTILLPHMYCLGIINEFLVKKLSYIYMWTINFYILSLVLNYAEKIFVSILMTK